MSVRTRKLRTSSTTRRADHARPRTWENATWADSRAVAAWLDANIEAGRFGACGQGNIVSHWRKCERASFWAIDRVFVALGLHVAQLPEDVWTS